MQPLEYNWGLLQEMGSARSGSSLSQGRGSRRPIMHEAWNNLGLLLAENGQRQKRKQPIARHWQPMTNMQQAWNNLGLLLAENGQRCRSGSSLSQGTGSR
jgi:hypothetical protein